MLKIIGFSLFFGFLSTWFSSPRFLWCNLISPKVERKIFLANIRESSLNQNFGHSWLSMQIISFVFISLFSCFNSIFSNRPYFGAGTVTGLIGGFFFKWLFQPDDAILPEIHLKKILNFWKIICLLYLVLFLQDNIVFQMANIPDKYEKADISEFISDENISISGDNLKLLLNASSPHEKTYSVDGKFVLKLSGVDAFLVIKNNEISLSNSHFKKPYFLTSALKLDYKNAKEIGITVDDENNAYHVYALFKKTHFLGKYYVSGYALWNPPTDKVTFYEELPDFAK